MALKQIRALTFDTGGTVLDWHSGFKSAFQQVGKRHGLERDWGLITNELRRRSMQLMLNLGEFAKPDYRFDDAHRRVLDELIEEFKLQAFDEDDRHLIAYEAPHRFDCWPDFPAAQARLREQFIVASFTILSYRLIIDTARHNQLNWDAVFSCEGIGKYKLLPEAYQAVTEYLQLAPEECCMVACHEYDLVAAQKAGYRTALVRRADEWGPGSTLPELTFTPDILVDSFDELVTALETGHL